MQSGQPPALNARDIPGIPRNRLCRAAGVAPGRGWAAARSEPTWGRAMNLDDKLVVAISSRALFNLEEENRIFESGDDAGYMKLQLERLDVPAQPGIAYSLVRKLLRFNEGGQQRVEVVILSRNDPVSGMRVFRSGVANGISLQRGVFTQGRPPFGYLRPLRAHLFLSVNAEDVREALVAGFPAARVLVESVRASDA